ncbi:MAG: DUF1761 domain-containing protein [Candidatus Margulisiibacteriota bacterium]|jgi:hypothetical protein
MIIQGVNIWAAITGSLISFIVSFVWYMILFRAPYIEGLGKTAEQLAKGPSMLVASVLQLIGYLVTAVVLAWLMKRTGLQSVSQGLLLAVVVWGGFVAAVLGPFYAFEAFSLNFFFITAGNVLVSLLIMGAIFGSWK